MAVNWVTDGSKRTLASWGPAASRALWLHPAEGVGWKGCPASRVCLCPVLRQSLATEGARCPSANPGLALSREAPEGWLGDRYAKSPPGAWVVGESDASSSPCEHRCPIISVLSCVQRQQGSCLAWKRAPFLCLLLLASAAVRAAKVSLCCCYVFSLSDLCCPMGLITQCQAASPGAR